MNVVAIISLCLGIFLLLVTQQAEVGTIKALFQPTAAAIVFGGTFCATFLNFPTKTIIESFKSAFSIFYDKHKIDFSVIKEITQLSQYARKDGILSLQKHIEVITNPFLKRGIQLAIDVNNTQLVNDILNSEIEYEEEQELIYSRIFEAMGGYSPTFGIVGAVLGLIQIMSYMSEPQALANGIATSFVATLYGVGAANLIFLPIAGCLKLKLREKMLLKEVILQGITSIHVNEHPAIVEEKLLTYLKYKQKTSNYQGVIS